jgi:hypothetical protein
MEPSLTQTHRILAANYNLLTRHVEGVLRDIWDPIWLGIGGPVDEYDRYAPGIVALVRDTTVFENTIIGHLTRIEAAEMCLPASHERTLRAARALLGLREACARAPDEAYPVDSGDPRCCGFTELCRRCGFRGLSRFVISQ